MKRKKRNGKERNEKGIERNGKVRN